MLLFSCTADNDDALQEIWDSQQTAPVTTEQLQKLRGVLHKSSRCRSASVAMMTGACIFSMLLVTAVSVFRLLSESGIGTPTRRTVVGLMIGCTTACSLFLLIRHAVQRRRLQSGFAEDVRGDLLRQIQELQTRDAVMQQSMMVFLAATVVVTQLRKVAQADSWDVLSGSKIGRLIILLSVTALLTWLANRLFICRRTRETRQRLEELRQELESL